MATLESGSPDIAESLTDLVDGSGHVILTKGQWFVVDSFHECDGQTYAGGIREDKSIFYCIRADQSVRLVGKLSDIGGF